MRKPLISFLIISTLAFTGLSYAHPEHYPAPSTVSEQLAVSVNAPSAALWLNNPKSTQEWQAIAKNYAQESGKAALTAAKASHVTVSEQQLAGVPVFTLTPPKIDKAKSDKVIYYIHGGGYILGHGVGQISEALPLAAEHGYRVVSVDYRMAPENPFPAAIDDAFTVYRELVKTYDAQNIAVYGTSTGGAMTLILALQAAQANVTQPAALISGTPWADMDKIGDTYVTNEKVDNILTTYDALIRYAANVYSNGHNLKDPLISPVYAKTEDLKQFPATLLISGTRDLFLSNTVRMHKRLLMEKVHAELVVYEAMSHAQYYLNPQAPETADHYKILDQFLSRTLLKH